MNKHKQFILEQLRRSFGDDLERAERAFQYLTPEQLDDIGDRRSSMTPREYLEYHRAKRKELNDAIVWLNGVQ